ncbi:sugar-binding protein [Pleomorphomonas carboxyditropha]|uniref:Sugar-binding protein n=1 Tax=Pleomorphomonas carboxyditropha TaxID=2023338 RepID=A0A2G9X1Q9_9HYPH|nr:sugar-binding protein [Pleomorphomonas carboxyditropha]
MSVRTYHALFVTPALVLSIAIVLLPALLTFGAAFSNWDGVSAPSFAGLNNFSSLFADPVFWTAIANNSLWTVIFLTIPMGIALLAASLLMRRQRASAAFQAIFLLPYVLSPVANAMIWQNIILSPVSGLLGFVSKNVLPLQSPLTQPETALYAVAAVDIWHFWGYLTVVFFAAMRQTPEEQLEAALLENASGWQVFRFVTLPNILPTLGLMLVLVTIFSFLTFDYIYLITQGGPARATEMLSTYAYKFAFTSFQVGKAAAVALVMCFFGLIASVVYVRISRASLEL